MLQNNNDNNNIIIINNNNNNNNNNKNYLFILNEKFKLKMTGSSSHRHKLNVYQLQCCEKNLT